MHILIAHRYFQRGFTVECMKRWKTIKDQYVRELKKIKTKRSGDARPAYTPSWCLFDILSFLLESVRHRN